MSEGVGVVTGTFRSDLRLWEERAIHALGMSRDTEDMQGAGQEL